ncbi:hypothetical protein [Methanopyrus sp.]
MKVFSLVEPSPAKNLLPVWERLLEEGWEVAVYGHGYGAEVLEWEGIKTERLGKPRRKQGLFGYIGFSIDLIRTMRALASERASVVLSSGNTGDARKSLIASRVLGIPSVHLEMDVYNPVEAVRWATRVLVPFSDRWAEILERRVEVKAETVSGAPLGQYLADRHLSGRIPGPVPEKYEGRVLVCLGGDITEKGARQLLSDLKDYDPVVVPFRVNPPKGFECIQEFVDLPGVMMLADTVVFTGGFGVTIEACVVAKKAVKVSEVHPEHLSHWIAEKSGIPIIYLNGSSGVEDAVQIARKPRGGWIIKRGRNAVAEIVEKIIGIE